MIENALGTLKALRVLAWPLTGVLVALASFGCGSVGSPRTAVVATVNPLVAQYSILGYGEGSTAWVEFGPDTNYGRQTSVANATQTNAGSQITVLVAGMKPQTTYHMRAHIQSGGVSAVDQDHTFTTGSLPTSQPVAQFVIAPTAPDLPAGAAPAPGVELLSLVPSNPNGLTSVVTDLQGNVIWFCPGNALPLKPMENGHYIGNVGYALSEVDLACNNVRSVSVDQVNESLLARGYAFSVTDFTHDMLVLPNGHWIGLCQTTQNLSNLPGYPGTTAVVGDALVDIDPDANVLWAWSAFDHLDVNRHPFGLPDWTHSNALVYTPDGNLLLSMRNQSWILKIDYANGTGSGNILWTLGEGGTFSISGGDPSQWFYGQHYPNLLSTDGSQMILAVYDDGDYRMYSDGVACGTTSSAPACYSRATIFQVDEGSQLATLLWQDLPGFYSFWGGSIGQLSNADVEFDNTDPFDNSSSQIMEVTQTTMQTVWQMNITGANAYRGYRIPSLYPGVQWKQ
jgi:arylsulfate sulfotransferase